MGKNCRRQKPAEYAICRDLNRATYNIEAINIVSLSDEIWEVQEKDGSGCCKIKDRKIRRP
jgi:hypothetical protein